MFMLNAVFMTVRHSVFRTEYLYSSHLDIRLNCNPLRSTRASVNRRLFGVTPAVSCAHRAAKAIMGSGNSAFAPPDGSSRPCAQYAPQPVLLSAHQHRPNGVVAHPQLRQWHSQVSSPWHPAGG